MYRIFLYMDSLSTATKLANISEKYQSSMNMDVYYGRYILDACSVLAMTSLIGNTVWIMLSSGNNEVYERYFEEVGHIGAYRIEEVDED